LGGSNKEDAGRPPLTTPIWDWQPNKGRIVRVLFVALMVAGLVGFLTMLWFVLAQRIVFFGKLASSSVCCSIFQSDKI
jgi:hypothetical protein